MNTGAEGMLQLSGQIKIYVSEEAGSPVLHALRIMVRDLHTVIGVEPQVITDNKAEADIVLRYAVDADQCPNRPEAFGFRFPDKMKRGRLEIVGNDDLGVFFGVLHFSQRYLGIEAFWYWADRPPLKLESVSMPCENYNSSEAKVRFRGWFVNDEVCLIGWKEPYPPSREVWLPVFEALLRCGGNMVIPGTDLPKDGMQFDIAAEMGLWVTHHHAEPLGAEMFLRAYPGKSASYQEEPELFENLWRKAIKKQKANKIVWVLSFRGQGDKPFWENDSSFNTPEKRGAMISQVIQKQFEMVGAEIVQPVCCVALYGEIAELYKGGHIEVPEGVIKVWADNGYGGMVSRRHGNLNLRVPALPEKGDAGKHGIYYHVTFHDLQASNHLTLFPGPATFIKQEVEKAFSSEASEYLLVNCGNIRPHVYTLDLIRELWTHGTVDPDKHLSEFTKNYYSSHCEEIAELYQSYADSAIKYGPNEDEWAGDEFYHHPARQIISHWLQGRGSNTLHGLIWATGDLPFVEQVSWFGKRCEDGLEQWETWNSKCDSLIAKLNKKDRQRAVDQLRFHGVLHKSGCAGLMWLCRAYEAYCQAQYPHAFVYASQSIWSYREGFQALRDSEHGKWERFYRADWLTNIESTLNNVDTLRRYLRMHGDSPDFFLWYKEFLMPETEKHIYLENTHRKPLSDDDLANRLKRLPLL